jgi:hypothetical protein
MADDEQSQTAGAGTQSSTEAGGEEQDPQAKFIEDLQKRQSGADKARDIAIRERDEALARLDALQAGKAPAKGSGEGNGIDPEALKQELRAEFAAETAKAVAAEREKGLKRLYPNATTKFPGVTDEAQLAELEEVYGTRQKPIGNNPPKAPTGQKRDEDMTTAELIASIKGMDTSNLW